MGKNKKWKRKAKRIKGECIIMLDEYVSTCYMCEHSINGYCECIISNVDTIPRHTDIRTIERICKYGK